MSDKNKAFSYSYSAAINDELEQLKEKYTPRKTNEKLKKIRALDKRVDFISTMISILSGIGGSALIVGGVIFIIKDIYPDFAGLLMTASGMLIISAVPFIHTRIYNLIKARYAPEILELIKETERNII